MKKIILRSIVKVKTMIMIGSPKIKKVIRDRIIVIQD